jgi:hypothetical protein
MGHDITVCTVATPTPAHLPRARPPAMLASAQRARWGVSTAPSLANAPPPGHVFACISVILSRYGCPCRATQRSVGWVLGRRLWCDEPGMPARATTSTLCSAANLVHTLACVVSVRAPRRGGGRGGDKMGQTRAAAGGPRARPPIEPVRGHDMSHSLLRPGRAFKANSTVFSAASGRQNGAVAHGGVRWGAYCPSVSLVRPGWALVRGHPVHGSKSMCSASRGLLDVGEQEMCCGKARVGCEVHTCRSRRSAGGRRGRRGIASLRRCRHRSGRARAARRAQERLGANAGPSPADFPGADARGQRTR